ncbi:MULTISPECIES: galactokinase [unclassified Mucilaginibacter]|uniref:galactokinase n=1 Tax=unclassified Mucilaginibacter TaxID=2617802 RepID=UPI002AC924AA|nr:MULTISPECIES: galactokinase [unclassified Mucilaginibacter]MEB0249065.1 galactokinase [Mucilaginibacter sp. 5B2]MEB0263585.1 galactokinase [Mucilaginibacter sp. 10I4]MEB0280747.1 galactokinase [Mucilaginibacter sp. 10B2]MEB0301464.1 galactokinase [Mucilaginibacter sp. 5C4]WPX22664.1 galactokinase [Mucilaginibacter sp. 5C4]
MRADLKQEFVKQYGKEASETYFSPGRVNLIGEHIDYNGGLVMPCAITFGSYLLVSPNNENVFRFKSLNFNEQAEVPLDSEHKKVGEVWYNYPVGVIAHFLKDGKKLQGIDMLFYGDIPIGSGLSSSASIEVVTAFALNDLFTADYSRLDLVKLSQSVENKFIGVNCGIMDQFAVAFGEKDKALMLNCDTLDYQAVDSNLGDYLLAIINTNKPRKLAESKYNERVQECQTALVALKQELDINYLCDIDGATFEQYKHLITDATVQDRAKHVVEENDRVKLAAKALTNNNLTEFGRLMYASHQSLRNLYEVSGIELDTVVDYAKTNPDVAGARMTGAGFGGCAIALVKKDTFDKFSEEVSAYYTDKIGYAPSVYASLIGDGVGTLNEVVSSK